jgi:hypothetical protein
MFPYRVATLCAFPVAYALAGEAKRDFSFLFHLWRNIDQGRLPADRAPLFSRFPAARLCRARSPHSSHSDPRQIPYRCSCPAYPRTLDSSVSVLSAGRLQPSETRLSPLDQFVFFHSKIAIFIGSLIELQLFSQAILVGRFPWLCSPKKTRLVGHGRNRVLPLESGILPWTFLKVRIRISFAPSCPG